MIGNGAGPCYYHNSGLNEVGLLTDRRFVALERELKSANLAAAVLQAWDKASGCVIGGGAEEVVKSRGGG